MITTLFNIFLLVLVINSIILFGIFVKEFSGSESEAPKPMTPTRNVFFSIWTISSGISFFGCLLYYAYILVLEIFF